MFVRDFEAATKNVDPTRIFNMDETLIFRGSKSNNLVTSTSALRESRNEGLSLRSTAAESFLSKSRICVTLAVSLAGEKLPPHILVAANAGKPQGLVRSGNLYLEMKQIYSTGPDCYLAFNTNGWLTAAALIDVRFKKNKIESNFFFFFFFKFKIIF